MTVFCWGQCLSGATLGNCADAEHLQGNMLDLKMVSPHHCDPLNPQTHMQPQTGCDDQKCQHNCM